MKIQQVAAQLYTVRDHMKTAADFAASMRKIREIGYTAVQLSGIGPISDEEVIRILDGEGLVCCATHAAGTTIIEETDKVIDQLRVFRCNQVAYPHPGDLKLETAKEVKSLASQLNAAGQKLHAAGMVLSYHNHSLEFRKVGGKTILETLYRYTSPQNLQAELDTYWVQHGGGDPVEWCKKMKGRLPLLHMKDFAVGPGNQPQFAEIGNGNLNWKKIVSAAEKSGCQWFIVEQDTCPGDPFESLRISFDYIAKRLVEKQ